MGEEANSQASRTDAQGRVDKKNEETPVQPDSVDPEAIVRDARALVEAGKEVAASKITAAELANQAKAAMDAVAIKEEEKERKRARIASLVGANPQTEADLAEARAKAEALNGRVETLTRDVDNANRRADNLENELAQTRARIAELEEPDEDKRAIIAQRDDLAMQLAAKPKEVALGPTQAEIRDAALTLLREEEGSEIIESYILDHPVKPTEMTEKEFKNLLKEKSVVVGQWFATADADEAYAAYQALMPPPKKLGLGKKIENYFNS